MADKPSLLAPARTRREALRAALLLGAAVVLGAGVQCSPRPRCSLDSLDIVSRAEWGAVDPVLDSVEGVYDPVTNPGGWMVYDEPLDEVLTTIIVHHSALNVSDGPFEIQDMHFRFKGYADIAYQFLINETGRIYEGRSLTVRGAHTGGYNTGTVGIVLLGNFMERAPTDAQLGSLRALSGCLIDAYRITHIAGHRDFQLDETDCPGDNLEALLPGLAVELGVEFGTEGYAGP
jgi:hypothetical protein